MSKHFRIVLFALTALLLVSCASKKEATANKATMTWQYEIEPTTGQATQGSILVKVWSYSGSKGVARTLAGKNAVHGVLFKGVAALNEQNARVPQQKPIVTDVNAEETHKEFLNEFFKDDGKYMKYVNFINNGIPAPGDIIKVGPRYKVGVRVSVAKDALRKEMEAAGIIKSLGAGF